eukprot:5183077-Amphidinium_carterae.2
MQPRQVFKWNRTSVLLSDPPSTRFRDRLMLSACCVNVLQSSQSVSINERMCWRTAHVASGAVSLGMLLEFVCHPP